MDTVVWNLKAYAKETHQIATAVQLQAFIEESVGVIVTVQTLGALLRSQPPAPRGEMIQLLCDVFNCRSDAFYVFIRYTSTAPGSASSLVGSRTWKKGSK